MVKASPKGASYIWVIDSEDAIVTLTIFYQQTYLTHANNFLEQAKHWMRWVRCQKTWLKIDHT